MTNTTLPAAILDEASPHAGIGWVPYAPRLMTGPDLYGTMRGTYLLSELERLARLDLKCMWVTGSISPNHANIGHGIFNQRKTIIERVFSTWRCQQEFNHFRRRGPQAVKRKFAMHILAYNLFRAATFLRSLFSLLYAPLRSPNEVIRYFF